MELIAGSGILFYSLIDLVGWTQELGRITTLFV